MGASSYTFACATADQSMRSWLCAMARALTFYGGCPQLIVPDNPRALVSVACRYDPKLNETVRDFARHYNVSILPARPFMPKCYDPRKFRVIAPAYLSANKAVCPTAI